MTKNHELKIRLLLACSSLAITMFVIFFIHLITSGKYMLYGSGPYGYYVLLGGFSVVSISVSMLSGNIFDFRGQLRLSDVLGVFILVLIVLQFCIGFILFANQQIIFLKEPIAAGFSTFTSVQEKTERNSVYNFEKGFDVGSFLEARVNESPYYDELSIVDNDSVVLYSSDGALVGGVIQYDSLEFYEYHMSDGKLLAHINASHNRTVLLNLFIDLATVFITSLFFTVEIVLLFVKLVQSGFIERFNDERVFTPLFFLRQITFVFYFASSLSSTFVSVVANKLSMALNPGAAEFFSALPQSCELLFNCFAIVMTAKLIQKKGWKLPFTGGLVIVSLGILLSAIADNIFIFIAARAVVGLGYGLSWMSLRNLVLYAKSPEEKTQGFSLLNAGIYAGISCGAVVGSIIADLAGYDAVFYIGAVCTVLIVGVVIWIENCPLEAYHGAQVTDAARGAIEKKWKFNILDPANAQFAFFVLLLVVPACITGSFVSYYMPINMTESLGKSTADIGRARLLYGLLIIYFGPVLTRMISKAKSHFTWSVVYNAAFAVILILFGLIGGGYATLLAATCLIGLTDSFGFVAHNSYFLSLPIATRLGESRSLSLISLLKKMAETLGAISFGLAMILGVTRGVIVLGAVFMVCALGYAVITRAGFRGLEEL